MTLLNAQDHTKLLGGEWHRRFGRAPCPICQPERRPDQRALFIRDGTGRLRLDVSCHNEGCKAVEIISELRSLEAWGIINLQELAVISPRQEEQPHEREARLTERRRREAQSLQIWNEAEPLEGGPAEDHLRKIGITCPLPDTLRYHNRCWHPFREPRPAIVALTDHGPWSMLQVSYLPQLGAEKVGYKHGDAYLNDVGGPVPLTLPNSGPDAPFVVTEGIESALALGSGLLPGPAQFISALSPQGMTNLRPPETSSKGWLYPADPGFMLVAGDGSAESHRAAWRAANRAKAMGFHVEVVLASEGARWIDVLNGRALLPPEDQDRIQHLFRECADEFQRIRHLESQNGSNAQARWANADDGDPL